MSFEHLLKSRMIVSSFIMLATRLIDGIEFVSQARPVCNQETQWTNTVTGVDISCETNTNREKACLFTIPILPPLTKLWSNRRRIGIAPLKFQGNVGCTTFMAETSRRICTSKYIVLNMSLASAKGAESITAK